MARVDTYAQCALLTGLNLRGGSGLKLFEDGAATDVDLPTYTVASGEGLYADLMVFLNGGVSQPVGTGMGAVARDFLADLNAQWTAGGGGGTFTGGFDANDKFYLENDTEDWEILGTADYAFYGYAGATGTVGGGAPFRHTATLDWTRGLVEDQTLKIDGATLGIPITIPGAAICSQDLPTLMRPYAVGDVDDLGGAQTLSYIHNTAHDPDDRTISWVLDSTGRVRVYWPTSLSLSLDFSNNAYQFFLDLIGYTGNESTATTGNLTYIKFEHPALGCFFPARPIKPTPYNIDPSEAEDVRSGAIASIAADEWYGWILKGWADGKAIAGSGLTRTAEDLDYHYRKRFRPYAKKGKRLTLIRGWGDARLHQDVLDTTSSRLAHSTLYTSHWRLGKWRLQVDSETVRKRDHAYDQDLAAYSEFTISAREYVA